MKHFRFLDIFIYATFHAIFDETNPVHHKIFRTIFLWDFGQVNHAYRHELNLHKSIQLRKIKIWLDFEKSAVSN